MTTQSRVASGDEGRDRARHAPGGGQDPAGVGGRAPVTGGTSGSGSASTGRGSSAAAERWGTGEG